MYKFIAILILSLIFNSKAYAYIDPGIGSIMLQAIIGGIAATIFTIKIYWQKIKDFFKKKKKVDFE
jgi:hypothetical protein